MKLRECPYCGENPSTWADGREVWCENISCILWDDNKTVTPEQWNHRVYPKEITELIEAAREFEQYLPQDDIKVSKHVEHLSKAMRLRAAIEAIKEE